MMTNHYHLARLRSRYDALTAELQGAADGFEYETYRKSTRQAIETLIEIVYVCGVMRNSPDEEYVLQDHPTIPLTAAEKLAACAEVYLGELRVKPLRVAVKAARKWWHTSLELGSNAILEAEKASSKVRSPVDVDQDQLDIILWCRTTPLQSVVEELQSLARLMPQSEREAEVLQVLAEANGGPLSAAEICRRAWGKAPGGSEKDLLSSMVKRGIIESSRRGYVWRGWSGPGPD